MKRDQVITLMKQHEPEFRAAGVGAVFLFGSIARQIQSNLGLAPMETPFLRRPCGS